jgi:hypothetical protein
MGGEERGARNRGALEGAARKEAKADDDDDFECRCD